MAMLTEREQEVLEAVIRTYVETAEPAGSRVVAKRHGLGVSPATIRNTMADLEEKGFLYHPHTSAGRVPTDLAYRYYVDRLMRPARVSVAEQRRLRRELTEETGDLERLFEQAAHALGLLTGELGIAVAPRLDDAVLEKLELISFSSEKVLLVLTLTHGLVRTVYVDVPASVPAAALVAITMALNERLAGRTLREIRSTLADRLRDVQVGDHSAATHLLNVFLQSKEEIFDLRDPSREELHLGRASVLAQQPEFASGSQLRNLIELTERRDLLVRALGVGPRDQDTTLQISIGTENAVPELSSFTLVTSQYRAGGVSGVIGVIGPTRMPYEKVAAIVEYTSVLVSELLRLPGGGAKSSRASSN